MFILIATLFVFALAALTLCLFTGVCMKQDNADPLFSEGSVSIKAPGEAEWSPLTEDSIITEGCEVITGEGSSLELTLPGNSIVKVGENSHVRFNTMRNIEVTKIARSDIDILYGKMRAVVVPFRSKSSSFTIRNENAAVGVRGTDFGVIASDDNDIAEILCFDGEVVVAPEVDTAEWEPVVVAADREVTLSANAPVGEPTIMDTEKRDAFLAEMALESLGETEGEKDDIPEESTPEPDVLLHKVEPGDTLRGLAVHYYGSETEYRILLDANRDIISDENLIYPGQELVIP
jgi:hypothetical protein